jgi:hypothetical protein
MQHRDPACSGVGAVLLGDHRLQSREIHRHLQVFLQFEPGMGRDDEVQAALVERGHAALPNDRREDGLDLLP